MVNAGLLKFHHAVVFHKAAITQEHGTRQRRVTGLRGEQLIKGDKESPAQSSQPFRKCRAGMLDDSEKLPVAERGLQMNALQRQIAAKIKAAGVAEIPHRAGPRQDFDAVSGPRNWGRCGVCFVLVKRDAQSPTYRSDSSRRLHHRAAFSDNEPPGYSHAQGHFRLHELYH